MALGEDEMGDRLKIFAMMVFVAFVSGLWVSHLMNARTSDLQLLANALLDSALPGWLVARVPPDRRKEPRAYAAAVLTFGAILLLLSYGRLWGYYHDHG